MLSAWALSNMLGDDEDGGGDDGGGSAADESERLPCGFFDNGMPGDVMCNACGYGEIAQGDSCPVCNQGTGINKYSPA